MAISLEQFASECHDILAADSGPAGIDKVRACLEKVLVDEEFLATHLGPDNEEERKILYQDPDLGFCIIAHVYKGPKQSKPHDHGPAWAIYGQARGNTSMTDWRKLAPAEGDKPGRVEAVETYELTPGMARAYNIGDLHSPSRVDETRLIRIEGMNMDGVKRDAYETA